MAEAKKKVTHTEAPASVTYSLTSPKGLGVLFTVRNEDSKELLQEMITIEESLMDLGYTKQVRSYGGGKAKAPVKYVEGKMCPKDGGKLLDKTTKMGKSFHECENRKYDFTTKQTSGCDFIDWLDSGTAAPTGGSDAPATEAQMRVLKEKGLWEEGMNKVKASEVIGGVLGK
jgi:hypothetical protein